MGVKPESPSSCGFHRSSIGRSDQVWLLDDEDDWLSLELLELHLLWLLLLEVQENWPVFGLSSALAGDLGAHASRDGGRSIAVALRGGPRVV